MEKQGRSINMIFAQADAEFINAFSHNDAPKDEEPTAGATETCHMLVEPEGPPTMDCDGSFFAFAEKNSQSAFDPVALQNRFLDFC